MMPTALSAQVGGAVNAAKAVPFAAPSFGVSLARIWELRLRLGRSRHARRKANFNDNLRRRSKLVVSFDLKGVAP
jgi:hypothetical protein